MINLGIPAASDSAAEPMTAIESGAAARIHAARNSAEEAAALREYAARAAGERARKLEAGPTDRASMFIEWCALQNFGCEGWPPRAHEQLVSHMEQVRAHATAAERERCARIAEDAASRLAGVNRRRKELGLYHSEVVGRGQHEAERIAAAIRDGGQAGLAYPYPEGSILRYGDGPTALFQVDTVHVGYGGSVARYYGEHILGGPIGAYHEQCKPATEADLATWRVKRGGDWRLALAL